MAGVDAVRGIGYQHGQAMLTALEVLDDLDLGGMRVEGGGAAARGRRAGRSWCWWRSR